MEPVAILSYEDLSRDEPVGRLVEGVDLVAVLDVSHVARVYYGRCQHRGALLADGPMEGEHLVCTLHGSTYDAETGRNRDDIQLLTAQLHRPPLLDEDPVATEVVIGPGAARPLSLRGPLLVSDMSFGALSAESKIAMSRGAERSAQAQASVPARAEFIRASRLRTAGTSMSWRRAGSGSPRSGSVRAEPSTSRWGRPRRPVRAATCRGTR